MECISTKTLDNVLFMYIGVHGTLSNYNCFAGPENTNVNNSVQKATPTILKECVMRSKSSEENPRLLTTIRA